jgi:hypothetical protein
VPASGESFLHYQLHDPLPRPAGSATEAFRATDTRAGVPVVVEIVRSTASSVEKARFGTRARRLVAVKHAALIAVVDAATTHCAVEALEGEPLSRHAGIAIARARQKLAWLAQVAGALVALHKAGIVHGELTLDAIVVLPGTSVKLAVPLGGNVGSSPLDDVRAFAAAACQLVLGNDAAGAVEDVIAKRVHDAGVALDAAAIIARIRAGASMTSEDLAESLAPFADAGPVTEPLIPVGPRAK